MMQGVSQSSAETPHLAPAFIAVIIGAAMAIALGSYGPALEKRSIGALAADEAIIDPYGGLYRLKNQGIALQRAAWADDGLLPVYGSSELGVLRAYNRPFHTTNLLRERPTGFTIFPVGKEAATCLITQQKLAAVGPALRGRKVVVSVSPTFFFEVPTAWAGGYAGNFSPLHAGELAFNTRLSLRLRRDAARRMLQYPETLAERPLLRFALESLADGSPSALACYGAAFPLGMLHNAILRYQDHLGVVWQLWRHPPRKSTAPSPPGVHPLDWTMVHEHAIASYRAHSDNNEFGLDRRRWTRRFREETLRQKGTRTDEGFLRALAENQEWDDLELVLRVLEESGARPYLISMPIHGAWYDQCGISALARGSFYRRLRDVGARHGAPVVDFADHDADRSFCLDYKGHLSPNGWVYYGEAFDGIFHDRVPPPSALPGPAKVGRAEESGMVARTGS